MSVARRAKAVAFDMDGLMVDTEPVYWKTASTQLRRLGHEYTQEICDQVMGRTPEFAFKLYIDLFRLDLDWRDMRDESEEIFIDLLDEGFSVTAGLTELLDELDRREIPHCVCTSSSRRLATEVLKRANLLDRFQFILTSDDITRGKPDPEIYSLAEARLGVEPSSTLVLEDSTAGCKSAVASGAFCFMLKAKHNFNADFSLASGVVERLDAPELFAALE